MRFVRNACLLFLAAILAGCATVPITGRSQLSLLPAGQLMAMSLQSYTTFLGEHQVSKDQEKTAMVKRVGSRIQEAVERYMADSGQADLLAGYEWQFNLVEDDTVNAWCMPGGKVVVYTGLLPVAVDEAGLAVVMGHEIAHAIANHGNERMSQSLAVQMGGMALSVALKDKADQTQQLFMAAYGVGAQIGLMLPYSRLHESEADHLGLVFMAMAGYDPRAAVPFWERMAAKKNGKAPPELLSTHPSDARRIARIRDLLPEALPYYRPGS